MTNRKNTRRALVLSILSLLVCCSMLVGTTFAWFTDSVTTGNNKIVAGNLDVELYNDVKVNEDKKVGETTPLFEEVKLWEPGVVAYENLTVANVGTLALMYELSINFGNENHVDGYSLSQILKVAFVPNGVSGTREQVMAQGEAAGWMDMASFVEGNYLLPGDNDVYGLVICWVPGADDNNWNVNNGKTTSDGKALHIDLGIELFATQKVHEDDSFGPDYDAGLATIYVSDYAQLVAALAEGGKIVLTKDIEMTAEETPAVPAGIEVVLDLNGNTLSHAGSIALLNSGDLTVIGNGTISSTVGNGLKNDGTVVIDGATITGATYGINNLTGGKVSVIDAVVNNGAFNGGEMVVYDVALDQNVSGRHGIYNSGTLEINGGEFESFVSNELIKADYGTAVINGGTFKQTGKSYLLGGAQLTINGGTFYGYVNADGSNDKDRGQSVIQGGTFNYDPDEADGFVARDNGNGTWTVVPEKYTTAVADGLYSDGNVAYAVSSANGLATLNSMMDDKSAGKNVTVELTADIDMTGKTWTPVDSHADTAFTFASLNGNGHTISNLTVNGQAMFTRFAGFGDVEIKDVTFENATINSTKINTSILTVQSYQNVTLDNVDVVDSYIKGGYKVAPLIGTVYNESSTTVTATLKNCDVKNTTVEATSYDFCTTGMVAFVNAGDNDKVEFENCTVSGVKLVVPYDAYKAHAFVYTTGSGTLYNEAEGVTVTNCSVESYMDGATTFAGGTLHLNGTYVTASEGENALTITGDTTLVVEGDVTLGGGKNGSGIYVADGVKLTVEGDGELTVYGNSQMEYETSGNYCEYDVPEYAGAGGSGIRGGEGSTITIKGLSSLTAEGYGVAGFGIGGNGATVTIEDTTIDSVRGGFVNVTGKYNDASYNKNEPEGGAAIGGEKITLTNVVIDEAVGGSKAAGIGARFWQPTDITITNCYIKSVTGGASSAGIGGSRLDNGDVDQDVTITIADSVITAQGGYFGAGIGSGYDTHCQTPDKAPMHTIYIKGDSTINATGGKYAAGIGTGYHVAGLTGEIEESVTVNATAGESREKYTVAMDVGFGVIDHSREANDANTSSFNYKGTVITVSDAPLVQ